MHKLCIIDNIWSGHFPPNVFGFGINVFLQNELDTNEEQPETSTGNGEDQQKFVLVHAEISEMNTCCSVLIHVFTEKTVERMKSE